MRSLPLAALFLATLPVLSQTDYDPDIIHQIAHSEQHRPLLDAARSSGPITRGFDMKYLRCAWDLDPAVRYISGSVTSWFTATTDLDQLIFDLSDTMVVDAVTRNGSALSFTHGTDDQLVITLPTTVPVGQLDSVTVTYHGVPPNSGFGSFETAIHAGAPALWTLSEPYGAKDWWPCKQDLNDKIDSLDTYVTTPDSYRVAGNGLLMASDTVGAHITWHWRHRYPIAHYLIATAVTNYQVDEQYAQLSTDSLLMLSYAYPEDFNMVRDAATYLLPRITFFDQLFGPYPFANEKYGHAQFGWGGGMEHQTMSFMGSFHPEIMSHELAHQWFGDKVTCGSWAEIWLNEGFATYLSGLAYEQFSPNSWRIWKRDKINNITSEPDGSVFCPDTTDIGRLFSSRLTYNKGAMVIHMLRWVCGDSAFFQGVRNYLEDPDLAYGSATTADLQAHLEATSGLDLTGFLADWYTGEGYPSYTTIWSQDAAGVVTVSLSQVTSHPSVDFFELPVPLHFIGGGTDSTVVLNNTTNNQFFYFHLPFAVDSVAFDPDRWLISAQNFTTTAQDLKADPATLALFPNPVKDRITWNAPNSFREQTARVLDALGRVVLTAHAKTGSLDISGLTNGSYVLELRGTSGPLRARFVKE